MSAASQRLHSVPRETTRTSDRANVEPSMEEILASIRRIIADDQAHSLPLPADSVNVDAGIDFSAITFDDEVVESDPQHPRDMSTVTTPAPSSVPIAEPVRPQAHERRDAHETAHAQQAAPISETASSRPGDVEAPPAPEPLLSSAADASAASAFSALSSVVLNRAPRTVDDLVQEMLRPLLKSWLDENLPPLVERLVKAEIERISRGKQ
ncbi:DUF2497 domain-containing protein [Pseudochelatococcus contaminans]|uniref:DUF2497 domain-containing protein n=1 Tax=Pseudochelatococcus contaminans TaxID=1538103 RepID=A0A7W6EGH1_9HYPH|nr:DUF2497 domain-containing protein [Pseudochelatococcus contaminans]MBB3809002.1 hypothetical protein [Pseudochelatococcus contaminans]